MVGQNCFEGVLAGWTSGLRFVLRGMLMGAGGGSMNGISKVDVEYQKWYLPTLGHLGSGRIKQIK